MKRREALFALLALPVLGSARAADSSGAKQPIKIYKTESCGCCKLTLEVLEKNLPAHTAYRRSGFKPYALDEELGTAQFWQRYL